MATTPTNRRTPAARWKQRTYLEDSLAFYLEVAEQSLEVAPREDETDGGTVVIIPSYASSIAARKEADRIRLELDQLKESQRVAKLPAIDDMWADLMSELRRLRASATAGNSFVAAANLLKLEHGMFEKEMARRKAEGPTAETAQEVLAEIQKVLVNLPPVLQQQLGGLLGRAFTAEA